MKNVLILFPGTKKFIMFSQYLQVKNVIKYNGIVRSSVQRRSIEGLRNQMKQFPFMDINGFIN